MSASGQRGKQRTRVYWLFTRHHGGYVRQRHLANIITSPEPWVAPYIVELIGEYVVEIIADIRVGLAELDQPVAVLEARSD